MRCLCLSEQDMGERWLRGAEGKLSFPDGEVAALGFHLVPFRVPILCESPLRHLLFYSEFVYYFAPCLSPNASPNIKVIATQSP